MQENEDCLNLYKNIGLNVRTERKAQKISQEALAFEINTARNYIGCIERGEKAPSVYTLYKIANALNIKLAVLMKNI